MAKSKFRPLHDRVVVKRIDAEEKSKGGIIIPDSVKEKIQATLDKFLRDAAVSDLAPADTAAPMIANPGDY